MVPNPDQINPFLEKRWFTPVLDYKLYNIEYCIIISLFYRSKIKVSKIAFNLVQPFSKVVSKSYFSFQGRPQIERRSRKFQRPGHHSNLGREHN